MIGILGGTFDPIHYGHLRPAQEVMRALGLDEVRLLVAGIPPHRPAPIATAIQRLEMARLACVEFPRFVVDDCEIRRPGPSYTVDTLRELRARVGERALCFMMGVDMFQGIETWREWQRLPRLAHLVVMHRPGWRVPDATDLPAWARARVAQRPDELTQSPAGRLIFQAATVPQDVSASRVRAALAAGNPVEQWLPKHVLDFIRRHRLYLGA